MSSKFRWASIVTLAAGLMLAGSTAAFAGGTPSPSPSQQTPTVYPSHHHHVRAALWQFDFTGAQIDGLTLNDVRGVGAIPMTRWQETDLNPFVSKFFRGPNSVTLLHNRLPLPDINVRTCTATFDQIGHFKIINGTGTGANFRNLRPGIFILRGLLSFDRVQLRNYQREVCPLAFINPFVLRALIEHNNLRVAGQLPSLVDFDVQGNALLVRTRPVVTPTPTPTGPGHFFAPSVGPNPDESVSA
jgi:hypothetical protein